MNFNSHWDINRIDIDISLKCRLLALMPFTRRVIIPFPLLIFNPESKVIYGIVCWMKNADNVKQYYCTRVK